jgi:hypothetical protein
MMTMSSGRWFWLRRDPLLMELLSGGSKEINKCAAAALANRACSNNASDNDAAATVRAGVIPLLDFIGL